MTTATETLTILARRRSMCPWCRTPIVPGDFQLITQTDLGWCHDTCATQKTEAAEANQEYYRDHPGQA